MLTQLEVSTSTRLGTLKVLFGEKWREFLAGIAWDLLEELSPDEVLYVVDIDVDRRLFRVVPLRFSIKFDITVRHAAVLITRLFGARFGRG